MILPKSYVLLGLASLTNIAIGAATPQPNPAAEIVPAPATEASPLDKRENNGANCWRYEDAYASYFRLATWGTWDQDWGQRLLGQLRSQCWIHGSVDDWYFGFEAGQSPTNGKASFKLARPAYDDRCVQDAIWSASNEAGQAINGVTCWESNKWW